MQRRKLVAANWKMNGSRAHLVEWATAVRAAPPACQTVLFPPFLYLAQAAQELAGIGVELGGQNQSEHPPGALTGEISAEMLVDAGARWVILGHSERRAGFAESDAVVAAKTARALAAGLRPIVCLGETLAQREQGQTEAVVHAQLEAVLQRCTVAQLAGGAIAYEPVWAIGTGHTASPAQAQAVHAALRAQLGARDPAAAAALRLLYGGSVKPANAGELFAQADIDGGLIGGAALVAADFLAICAAAAQ